MTSKAGFGGGCHWCTEAVFSSLKGVQSVDQGWIASDGENADFSEAVIVAFDPGKISFENLIEIHLHTHSSTSNHSMRGKYRSAIYYFSDEARDLARMTLASFQTDFEKKIITKVLPFIAFQSNREDALNYYFSNPERPFCTAYINPKLKMLMEKFSMLTDSARLGHLKK